MKKNIPVMKLMPKPMSPNGSSRCTEANDIPRRNPTSRRLTIISTPNISDIPMKCSVSHVGHTNGCCRTKSLIIAADRNGAPGAPLPNRPEYWPPSISGCRMSPPMLAARATAATVRTVSTSTV